MISGGQTSLTFFQNETLIEEPGSGREPDYSRGVGFCLLCMRQSVTRETLGPFFIAAWFISSCQSVIRQVLVLLLMFHAGPENPWWLGPTPRSCFRQVVSTKGMNRKPFMPKQTPLKFSLRIKYECIEIATRTQIRLRSSGVPFQKHVWIEIRGRASVLESVFQP